MQELEADRDEPLIASYVDRGRSVPWEVDRDLIAKFIGLGYCINARKVLNALEDVFIHQGSSCGLYKDLEELGAKMDTNIVWQDRGADALKKLCMDFYHGCDLADLTGRLDDFFR